MHLLILDAHAEPAHQFLACTLSASISSWCLRSVHASVPYAHAHCSACFEGTFSNLEFLRLCWAYVYETDACTEYQFLTHMLSMFSRDLFKFFNFYAYAEHTREKLMRMLMVSISSWCICSANASIPDPYAQGTHQFLMRMLSMFGKDCTPCSH